MPVITFEGGVLGAEQKKDLIHRLTETCIEATGIPEQFFTVILREHPDENLGVGGKTVVELKEDLARSGDPESH